MVVKALDEKIIVKVGDIVMRPPDNAKCNAIKEVLIQRITTSEGSNHQILLKDLALGDRTPSDLLRQMRSLTENTSLG